MQDPQAWVHRIWLSWRVICVSSAAGAMVPWLRLLPRTRGMNMAIAPYDMNPPRVALAALAGCAVAN